MNKKLETLEEETFTQNDSVEIPPPDIVAYNELRSCADLHRMKTQGVLEIQPEFQREFVWKNPDQTRFIDSLIKQLPIPSMCFSLDYKLQKWYVIDGLQRMATICRFLSNETWKLSKLTDIDPAISGANVKAFHDPTSDKYRLLVRIQNLTLPITVLRCDYSKETHSHYLFTIFHRLNTGGMKLNNQEIRNCIFSGKLNNLLKELNKYPDWLQLNRMKKSGGDRFIKQELILRLLAFHDKYVEYAGRLARFLNDYMSAKRNPSDSELTQKGELFERTVSFVYRKIFKGTLPPKTPLSIFEATLVGVSFNLGYLEKLSEDQVAVLYKKLTENAEFSENKLVEGLSGKARVKGRIKAARRIFSGK